VEGAPPRRAAGSGGVVEGPAPVAGMTVQHALRGARPAAEGVQRTQ
jgi:hypothetical protein